MLNVRVINDFIIKKNRLCNIIIFDVPNQYMYYELKFYFLQIVAIFIQVLDYKN